MIGKIKSIRKEEGRVVVELTDSKYKIIFESPVKDFYKDIEDFNLAAKDFWLLNKNIMVICITFKETKPSELPSYIPFYDISDLYMTLIKKKEYDDVIEVFLMIDRGDKFRGFPLQIFMKNDESIKSFPVSIHIE